MSLDPFLDDAVHALKFQISVELGFQHAALYSVADCLEVRSRISLPVQVIVCVKK